MDYLTAVEGAIGCRAVHIRSQKAKNYFQNPCIFQLSFGPEKKWGLI